MVEMTQFLTTTYWTLRRQRKLIANGDQITVYKLLKVRKSNYRV